MIERFLTTEQVANILQIHPLTVLKFLKSGKLKGIKLGRVYRIKETDVQEFLERMEIGEKTPKYQSENKTEHKKEHKAEEKEKDDDPDSKVNHYYVI